MNQMTNRNGGQFGTISYKTIFRAFFFLWWMYETVLHPFVRPVLNALPIIGMVGEYIIPVGMVCLLLLSLPYIGKNIRPRDVIFYVVVAIVVLGTMVFYPKNAEHIEPELWRILGLTVPVYFLGLSYDQETMKKDVYWASVFSLAAKGLYQLYLVNSSVELIEEDMHSAYMVLPSIMYLIYWAFHKKNILHWVLPVAGFVLLFSYGTRGPIVIGLVYVAAMLFLHVVWKRKSAWRYVGTALLAIITILLLTTDILVEFAEAMTKTFEELGISTRIFDKFLEGEFAESNAREILAEKVKEAISDNLLFGLGLYADRVLINAYAHNLFLELWCHFGIFIGTAIALVAIGMPLLTFFREKNIAQRDVLLMLMCLMFVKLMLSSSYAREVYLFFLLGYAVSLRRSKRSGESHK